MRMKSLAAVLTGFLLLAVPVGAQAPEPDVSPELVTDIDPSAALIDPDPLEPLLRPYDDLQQYAEDSLGLVFELGYTLIFQQATARDTGAGNLWTGSYDIVVEWTLFEHDTFGSGLFGMLVEGGHIIGNDSGEDLSAGIGSILGVNDDLDTTDIAVTELWWAQGWLEDTVEVTFGKIDQTVFFDTNRIANDQTTQFIATPLVNNASIVFPDNGLGVNLILVPHEWFYVTAGFGDANAVASRTGFDTFNQGDYFTAVEAGFTPVFDALGAGNYRTTGWTTRSAADGSASGVALSFDQGIGCGLVPFFRYGYATGSAAPLRHFVSLGLGIESPFGRADDLFAIGGVWADPYGGGRDETLVEMFYRLQLTDTITITPDIQVVIQPSEGDGDVVGLFGARLQAVF